MSTALSQRVDGVNNLRVLLKGKKLPIGSKRKRGNQWWMKTATGWKYSGMVASPTAAAPPTTIGVSTTPTRNEQILAEFQTGGSTADIATKHGLSVARVRQIIYQQKRKPTTVTATGDIVIVKSKKTELFDKLTDKQKETSRTTGVIPADKDAANYVQKNMDDIFGKAGEAESNLPKYIKKITTDPNKVYGKKSGWMNYPQIWKQLEDDPSSWDGNAETGAAFLAVKDKLLSGQNLMKDSFLVANALSQGFTTATSLGVSEHRIRKKILKELDLDEAPSYGDKLYDEFNTGMREETQHMKNLYTFDFEKTLQENLDSKAAAMKALEAEGKEDLFSLGVDKNPTVEAFVDRLLYSGWKKSFPDTLSKEQLIEIFKSQTMTYALRDVRDRIGDVFTSQHQGMSTLLDLSEYDNSFGQTNNLFPSDLRAMQRSLQHSSTPDNFVNAMLPTFSKWSRKRYGAAPNTSFMTVFRGGKMSPGLEDMYYDYPDLANYMISQGANVHLQNHLIKTLKKDPKNIKLDVMNKETWEGLMTEAGMPPSSTSFYDLDKLEKVVRDYAIEQRKKTFANEAAVKKFEKLVSGGGKAGNFILRTVKGDHLKKVKSLIENKWDKVAHGGFGYNIKGVYAIEEPPNQNKFNKVKADRAARKQGDTRFLYHGTHFTAAVAISRDKFRVPKVAKTGRMLGRGVYLAENSSKSCQYLASSFTRQSGSRGILFVCETALGSIDDGALHTGADTVRMQRGAGVVNTEYCVRDPDAVLPRMWVDIELT